MLPGVSLTILASKKIVYLYNTQQQAIAIAIAGNVRNYENLGIYFSNEFQFVSFQKHLMLAMAQVA